MTADNYFAIFYFEYKGKNMLNWRSAPKTKVEKETESLNSDSPKMSKFMKLLEKVEESYHDFSTELYRKQARIVLSNLLKDLNKD